MRTARKLIHRYLMPSDTILKEIAEILDREPDGWRSVSAAFLAAMGLLLVWILFASSAKGQDYQFPKGVPVKASEVTFYQSTPYHQNPRFGYITHQFNRQSWNDEFPWKTGGLDASSNAATFKFRKIPGEIKRSREVEHFFSNGGYYDRWKYPVGTLFGEVIQVDGRTTEVGLILFTGKDDPEFKIYRPYRNKEDISKWITSESIKAARLFNPHPNPGFSMHLSDRHGNRVVPKRTLDVQGLEHNITLSKEGVDAILAREFVDATDVAFSEKGNLKCYSPTTEQKHSIVPVHSQRGFFSTKECLACHKTAGMEGRLLDPNPAIDKYGNIRGNDHVFSFLPGK